MKPLSKKDIKFIYSQTESSALDLPADRYYAVRFRYPPSMTSHRTKVDALVFKQKCLEVLGAIVIHQFVDDYCEKNELRSYTLEFPLYPGYILDMGRINYTTEGDFLDKSDALTNDNRCLSDFNLLMPPPQSELRNLEFERKLYELVKESVPKEQSNKGKIRIIESRGHGFSLIERPVRQDFTIRDLDINYGEGFTEFHNELIARFVSGKKGLILFHGVPGTGKTYYIRHLLKELARTNKVVIYMPPNLVENLTDPMFITFLHSWVESLSQKGQSCILLIEDAEPLLTKRQEGVRVQGITNLLNMTDGLLNDMLHLQVVCTFNVGLRKLDSALLRPGRLLARKEFKSLSVLDANLLGQRLGIKKHFTKPTSLGEIYSLLQNQNTLVHDVEPNEDASNPIDDLV